MIEDYASVYTAIVWSAYSIGHGCEMWFWKVTGGRWPDKHGFNSAERQARRNAGNEIIARIQGVKP